MLRRYLIVNGATTVAMYLAIWAIVPDVGASLKAFKNGLESVTIESPLIGPLLHRIVGVSANSN